MSKFEPLKTIQDRAELFSDENVRLLAELLHTDPPEFERLMESYRQKRFRAVQDIEALAKRTLKTAKNQHKEKKASADGFQRDHNTGAILTNQDNILTALDRLGVRLRYDEFKGCPIIEGLPGRGPLLDDPAMNRLYFTIDKTFDFRPSDPYFTKFIMDCCYENGFHPVLNYLDGLEWDGVPRLDTWLVRYAGIADSELARACGKNALIAAVRRVRHPGTKFDEMIVLEGVEGLSKSTLLRLLAVHEDWFTDSLPLNADDKTMIESSGGKWIVEIAELQGISKADHTRIKAQLSRQVDRARLAYGRLPTEVKRQFVVFGTTNGTKYLASLTGNRRFLPFRVTDRIDLEAFKADRDQLWAEANQREAAGESIMLPEHLWCAARREQEARELDNPYYDKLLAALRDREGIIFQWDAWDLLGVSRPLPSDYEKLDKAMEKLGFVKRRRELNGVRQQAFVKWPYGGLAPRLGLLGVDDKEMIEDCTEIPCA